MKARHRAGPASAESDELEAWRRGKQTGRHRGTQRGTEHGSRARKKGSPCVIPMPNIYRTISIRQLVVTPGWTVFHLPSTPRVVVLPDTVAFRPFSARSPLLPHAGVLLKVRHRLARRRPSATAARQPETCALCAAVSSDAVHHGDEAGDAEGARRRQRRTSRRRSVLQVLLVVALDTAHRRMPPESPSCWRGRRRPSAREARAPCRSTRRTGCSTAPRRTPSGVLDARAVLISGAR